MTAQASHSTKISHKNLGGAMGNFKKPQKPSGQTEGKNVNKVIELKSPGTRRVQMRLDMGQKKMALTASILSIIAIVTFLNHNILSRFESPKRGIASIDSKAEFGFQWQKEMAEKLAKAPARSIASVAETPSRLDELRFGFLEGKYSFFFIGDNVSEIKFRETNSQDRPKYITDFIAFLKENSDVLIPNLSDVKALGVRSLNENVKQQVLNIYDAEQKLIGEVQYNFDGSGRFLSMRYLAQSN